MGVGGGSQNFGDAVVLPPRDGGMADPLETCPCPHITQFHHSRANQMSILKFTVCVCVHAAT